MRADKFKLLQGDDVLSTCEWLQPGGPSPASATVSVPDASSAWATGELAQLGGRFHAIHVSTLDDVDKGELALAPLNFLDSTHDRPDRALADVRLM